LDKCTKKDIILIFLDETMRVIKYLFRILLVLIVVFCMGGFFIPAQWSVTRSLVIHAPSEIIYPLVSNFKEWNKWVPWNTSKDKSLQYIYEGPAEGIGAKQSWTSEKMGKGWMQMTQANPQIGVGYDLYIDMGSPSTLQGTIRFVNENDGTKVIWTDKGDSGTGFIKRWMSLLIKPMLGKEFTTGLNNLKVLVEKT
jgi:hypothetical protein